MRILLRSLLVLAAFLGVGYGTMHVVVARAVAHGAPEYSVRMAGAMAGLFAGGIAAILMTLIVLLGPRKPRLPDQE